MQKLIRAEPEYDNERLEDGYLGLLDYDDDSEQVFSGHAVVFYRNHCISNSISYWYQMSELG